MIRFSERSRAALEYGPWAEIIARAGASAETIVDLTVSNPTQVDLPAIIAPLREFDTKAYEPDAVGSEACRESIARYYRRRGRDYAIDRIWVGSSTSEIYQQLFAVLGDPGSAVALPRPGYPLLQHLAQLAGLAVEPYALTWEPGGWHLDLDSVRRLSPRCSIRAVVAVSPNNPTGHVLGGREFEVLLEVCRENNCPLILDEVFADYPLDGETPAHPSLVGYDWPIFVLSGLSKVAALPQVKLSWGAYHGPRETGEEAVQRLAFLADTQLSVSGWVQAACPELLDAAEAVQPRIRQRLRTNWAAAAESTIETPWSVLPTSAGWSAVLRLPEVQGLDDLGWARLLLERDRVLTQPGYLFDLDRDHYLVVSLLTAPDHFRTGIARIAARVEAVCRR